MNDIITMSRDSAYRLINMASESRSLSEPVDRNWLVDLADGLDAQPRREGRPDGDPLAYDAYAVWVEYAEGPPIAVRTTPEAAFLVARIYNLGRDGNEAAVYGYRTNDVGPGVLLHIPAPS